MSKYAIPLLPEEQRLLDQIDLYDDFDLGSDNSAHLANKVPINKLLALLSDRKAIPKSRVDYWMDPDFQHSRMKGSHKSLFERHGNRGMEIYSHVHFLPFLRYFLLGPNLPEAAIASFEAKVGNPEWVTSSDIVPLGKHALALAREHRLDKRDASEEFFKLAMDMGLGLSTAGHVRQIILKSSL